MVKLKPDTHLAIEDKWPVCSPFLLNYLMFKMGGGCVGGFAVSPGSRSFVVQKRLCFGCAQILSFSYH